MKRFFTFCMGAMTFAVGLGVFVSLFLSASTGNGQAAAAQAVLIDDWKESMLQAVPAQPTATTAQDVTMAPATLVRDGWQTVMTSATARQPRPQPEPEPLPSPEYGKQVALLSWDGASYAVVEGTDEAALQSGPGHYRSSALPGQEGNFAVAGHRTTYGAPFAHIDALQPGDEIQVQDAAGASFIYVVAKQRVVSPDAVWVIGDDPLGHGKPTLTLTTCHPRYSARQRLVVWAELR